MSLILSGTDGLSDIDGSASTPAIRGTDTNTGIFFPAADTIAFSEGGVESMRIDSSGNLGIGTSSPSVKLDVSGGSIRVNEDGAGTKVITVRSNYASLGPAINVTTNDPLLFLTNNTERARIDSSGNVGIGTSTPAAKLEVVGNIRINGGSNTLYTTSADLVIQSGSSGLIRFANNDGANERARIGSSGDLLVGTTTSVLTTARATFSTSSSAGIVSAVNSNTNLFCVNTNNTSWDAISFRYNTSTEVGRVACTSTATSYLSGSDYRLKENIQPMTGALAKVAALKPCTYKWKIDGSDGEGFIAHELAEVCPQAVSGEKDAVNEDGSIKPQGIDTSFLVATLTAAIQEQQALIQSLTARIAALEAKE